MDNSIKYSAAQRAAIYHDNGPAMVVAGPGSGKTFVITHRIQFLIKNLGISPNQILVITYTKAAAKEMRERALSLLGTEITNLFFGTFHSLFYKILLSDNYQIKDEEFDYDKLVEICYRRLSTDIGLLNRWRNKIKYILIDEFQDIDEIQFKIVKLLLNREQNLFVVGDDDQSIYSFRGSRPDIMLGFKQQFLNCSSINLSINYRCASAVVDAASKVISKNTNRFAKDIISGRDLKGTVIIKECIDRYEEAKYINHFIKAHCGMEGDIALIFRTNKSAHFYEEYFTEKNIPYISRDSAKSLSEHFIVKDIQAYLRLVRGDHSRGNFYRIMNRPERYIFREDVDELVDIDILINKYIAFPRAQKKIMQLREDIKYISSLPVYGIVHYILYKIGYLQFLKDYASERSLDHEVLFEIALDFLERAKLYKSIDDMLRSADKQLCHGLNIEKQGGYVNIMTMHASKGLEYKYVIIPELIEGVIPNKRANTAEAIEEERRMLYVAMTRAKDELHMLYPKKYLGKESKLTEFL